MSPEQLEAYRKADYVVFADPPVVLRVGKKNAKLDELIKADGASTAAFVTAANPRGERRPDAENGVANAALQSLVQAAGYPYHWGEGRDPFGTWSEPSFLVIGIYRANAEALGQLFEQNAIVYCELGRAPELVILRGEEKGSEQFS
ncbi:MAG TPA: DUF3293 domain-containing protein [Burkholderiales bacterium]|nr:DUF3293 domain-containing protein [Burkholderiales bacterium]